MTIGLTDRFPRRAAVATCALCVAGLLALTPATAAAEATAPAPGAAVPGPALLYHSGVQVRPHAGAPAVPDVSALSWLVADADTGEVLAANQAHLRLPPASTLKTLFALTVLPALPAGLEHRVTPGELADVEEGSSLVGVEEGHTYRVADLWRGVFLSSGNDAVHVLAALDGGWDRTVTRMQTKARSLGALDTHVESPDGYDAPGQVSSAYDLAVFGRTGLRNPDFARYCSTAEARFPAGDGWSFGIENTNRLLTGEDGVGRYPGMIGIKNGYTSNAGNTLVAAARRGGRTLVVTVMNPQDGGVYDEARQLLDWGFGAAGRVDPVGSLDALRPAPRPGPSTVPMAAATASQDDSGWPDTAVVAAVAALGAGAVTLAMRLRGDRSDRSRRAEPPTPTGPDGPSGPAGRG
ncbi:D-alanyl-D-alanine carboxypeptidase family protein [Streptomyces arenae]|uniref:D-alanyl-D-alanine carboxypeptidase family protein n=1 Tax=Streptomyces arenae TaxID=29301 RepID=UPI002658FAAC|nr:D-alanyl-D-alanine carboxypeptidase family protein [Streptomyces arenae]MCG7205042.1 D-alanyl-D-alanine carboxypeptidase [Streptomyces arenae]